MAWSTTRACCATRLSRPVGAKATTCITSRTTLAAITSRRGPGVCQTHCASCSRRFGARSRRGSVGPLVHTIDELGLAQALGDRAELGAMGAAPAQVLDRLTYERNVIDECRQLAKQ